MAGDDLETLERQDTIKGGGGSDTVMVGGDDDEQFRIVDEPGEDRTGGDDDRVGDQPEDRSQRSKERLSRNQRRQRGKVRSDATIDLLQAQLEDTRSVLADVQRRQLASTTSSIDERLEQSVADFRDAEALIAGGAAGPDLVRALRQRDLAFRNATALENEKKGLTEQRETTTRRAPQPAPEMLTRARDWMADHSWYNANGTDQDSGIVRAIDNALLKEGFDPKTDDYFDELSDRVRDALPHRFKGRNQARDRGVREEREERPQRLRDGGRAEGDEERPQRRGPPVGGSGSGRVTEVYISPERRKALQEAGAFDDPVKMKRLLSAYSKYDKEHRNGR